MSTCICRRPVYGRETHDCCRYWLIEQGRSKCPACSESDIAAREWARRQAEKAKQEAAALRATRGRR